MSDMLSSVERERLIRALDANLYGQCRAVTKVNFSGDIKNLLKEFGLWSRQGVNTGRIRSCIQIFIDGVSGGASRSAAISDDQAMRINDALVALMNDDAESANVLFLYYISALPEYLIAERLHFDRRKVKSMLSRAEGFISGFLCSSIAA